MAVAVGLGCGGPTLDVPQRQDGPLAVDLEPPGDEGSVPLSFRGRIRGAPPSGAPWLIRGELSDYYERALRRAEVPAALRERAVPLRFWRSGADCFVQPLAWLEPEVSYTLAWEGVGRLRALEARVGRERPVTSLFPAPGHAKHRLALVCDLSDPHELESLVLEPGSVPLRSLPELYGVPRAGCVTLLADDGLAAAAVSPPRLGGALLDPAPWLPAAPLHAGSAGCAGVGAGKQCLDVQDDRVVVVPGDEERLWLVELPGPSVVASASGSRTLLLRGLAPERTFQLRASVLSERGGLERVSVDLTTGPARRHLVLNEVLANPLGPESSSEWIELLNDSDRSAWLGDLWLADAGGRVALPDVELSPGELVLLVSEAFQPSGLDVPIPEGVRLVRLASLATRGLTNGGEALLLFGPEGTLSRFPGLAPKEAGHSVARRAPDAADDDASAFAEHAAPGASPGAPNQLD